MHGSAEQSDLAHKRLQIANEYCGKRCMVNEFIFRLFTPCSHRFGCWALRKELLVLAWRVLFVEVHSVEAQRIDERLGLLPSLVVLKYSDGTLDLDRRLLVERALRVHVIVKNDRAGDGAETQHRHLLTELATLGIRNLSEAAVGHASQEATQRLELDCVFL